ncbi:MAG: fluoride efflux transporter CrcB [Candidatus Xenobia bacterium]
MGTLRPFLLISLGGIVGANFRYLVGTWAAALFGTRFPLGTFIINVTGCLLLGLTGTLAAQKMVTRPDDLRYLVNIGFCGAYTTFSTFEYETSALMADGQMLFALANIIGSVLLGFVGVRLGILLARFF